MATPNTTTRRDFLDQTLRIGAGSLLVGPLAAAEGTESGGWQIGCFTRPWDKFEYRVALDAIAEAGFKHAGLMTTKSKTRLVISTATSPEEAREVTEEVKKRGLQVPCVYGGGIPLHRGPKVAVDALRKLIDNCVIVRSKSLMMGGVGKPEHQEPYYKAIAECCDYAAEKGVELVLKPHGGSNATGPQCRKVIEKVGHKNFRLWYDPGNIFYYSNGRLDPVDDAAAADGLVTGMCIKDYKHPKQVWVNPGAGKVDFPAVLARLRKGGFRQGPLVIETLARGTQAEILAFATQARKFVAGLVRPSEA